jgi:hypothetical protein
MKNVVFAAAMLFFVASVFGQDEGFHLDKEYHISSKGKIDLRSSDAMVFITGSNRSTARVKIDRKITSKGWSLDEDRFSVEVEEVDGNLTILERQSGSHVSVLGYYREEYRIELEVPRGVSLSVIGDDGDYYIKDVDGSVALNLDDADAELAGCTGSSFDFRLDDGDIRMDSGRGNLTIKGDDADVEIHHANFSSIDVRIDDGDLIIETELTDEGQYFVESQDGTISLNITGGGGEFEIHHDDARIITEGNFTIVHKGEREMRVALPNGSARFSIRADDASVKLAAR